MTEKEKRKRHPTEITFDSTEEELEFARKFAGKALTAAKKNFTRSVNLVNDILKEDKENEENLIRGKLLIRKAEDRYDQLEQAFEDLNQLGQDPDDNWIEADEKWLEIQARYISWSKKAPTTKKEGDHNPIYSVVGLNYDIKKNIKDAFSGADPRAYQSWRINWEAASRKMTDLGYTDAMKLMELKKVTKDQANELIRSLPEVDANLILAIETLDDVYQNNIKVAELAITDLIAAPRVANTPDSVMKAYIAIVMAENTLKGMNLTDGQRGELLFSVIAESKLNNPLIKAWEDIKMEKADNATPLGHTATQTDFNKMLVAHFHLLKTFENNKKIHEGKAPDQEKKKEEKEKEKKKSGNSTIPGGYGAQKEPNKRADKTDKPKKCLGCQKEGHSLMECYRFTACKTAEDRKKLLAKVNICRNCLKGAHQTKDCRQQPQCNKCSTPKYHHPLLHEDGVRKSNPAQQPEQDTKSSGALKNPDKNATPILQACQAWLVAPGGDKYLATVFLDSGSEITLIRRDLANEVGLNGKNVPFQMAVAGGGLTETTTEKEVQFQLQSLNGSFMTQKMSAITSKIITRDLRPVDINTEKYNHLKGITFTEEFPRKQKQVDVLVGVQYYTGLLKGEIIRGRADEPMAISTKLGYILSGSA